MDVAPAINPILNLFLLCLVLGEPIGAQTTEVIRRPAETRTAEVIREIAFLTADSTLMEIVRGHSLATLLDVPDEAAAVVCLRGMIDLTEDPAGNAFDISVLSDNPNLAVTLTNAVADARAGHRAGFPETDRPKTKEDVAADLKQQETFVEASRNRMMRVMKDFSIIDPLIRKHAGEDALPHPELPLEFVRAKRSYEQQLSVLNYVRETSRPLLEKSRPAEVDTSLATVERRKLPPEKKRLIPLANLPAASAQPQAILSPKSRWIGLFWLVGGIAILILLLVLIWRKYVNRPQ